MDSLDLYLDYLDAKNSPGSPKKGNTPPIQEKPSKIPKTAPKEPPTPLLPYRAEEILESPPGHWTEKEYLYLWREILIPEERVRIARYLDRLLPWERELWFKQKTADTIAERGGPLAKWPGERRPTDKEEAADIRAIGERIAQALKSTRLQEEKPKAVAKRGRPKGRTYCYICFLKGEKKPLKARKTTWEVDEDYQGFLKMECPRCKTVLYQKEK